MKKVILIILCFLIPLKVFAEEAMLDINAKSSILIEQETGKVLYEQNADEKLPIASVTKIMTMLLAFEAIDEGKLLTSDMVQISERAMSMGGSTMFLKAGYEVSVDELLKGIAVASANDGAVAIAEKVAGTEEEFVRQMNAKAKELNMKNTCFKNTNGLDADGHLSSARDVSIMSMELLKHKGILNYTTIWMDTVQGGKYQLSNTNKLIRFFKGATGLKTGSTSTAGCCISASAERDGLKLIAVVLGAPNSKERFGGAEKLLSFGFSAYSKKDVVNSNDELIKAKIKRSTKEEISCKAGKSYTIIENKNEENEYQIETKLNENLKAPTYEGDEVGEVIIKLGGKEIEHLPLVASEDAQSKSFIFSVLEVLGNLI